jgi:hypothetical protein
MQFSNRKFQPMNLRLPAASIVPVLAGLLAMLPPSLPAQEKTVAISPSPIESFEIVPGFPRNGIEYQGRNIINANAAYYGLKYPQPWTSVLSGSAVAGAEFEVMSRPASEFPPGATVNGRYLFAAGDNGILRYDRQAPDRNAQSPKILATSGQHPFFDAAGIAKGSDLLPLGSRIYWGEVDGTRIQVWSHGVELGGFSILHAQTNYGGPAAGHIKRFKMLSATESLALTQSGALYVFRHDDLFTDLTGPAAMTLLATGVTGFDSRLETYSQGGFPFSGHAVYFTIGHTLQANSPPAMAQRRRQTNLGGWTTAATVYSTGIGASGFYDTLTEVAVDGGYVYLRRAAVSDTVFGILAAPADTTLRADSPAATPASSLVTAAIPADGNNLRADNFHLYFARGAGIYRVPNNVAPIPIVNLDFQALAVEITQSTQTMDHRVTLVTNKRTFVRGYARERVNQNTGVTGFSPEARLHVYFKPAIPAGPEVELTNPINPLAPKNRPVLLAADLQTLRPDTAATYLWELPQEFINRSGWLRVKMVLLSSGAATETRDEANLQLNPALNNTASSNHHNGVGVPFTLMPEPCLLFVPVETYGKRFIGKTLAQENLGAFIERAVTQLPVAGMRHWVALDLEIDDLTGRELNMDGWGAKEVAIADLYKLWFFYKDPPGSGDTHWVGCVHPDAKTDWEGRPVVFNGIGTDGEQSIITLRKNNYSGDPWPGSSLWGGFNLAHELGHNWDQDHVNFGGPAGPFSPYPYPTNWIGPGVLDSPSARAGYDPISNTAVNEVNAADLMSYGNRVWISDFIWDRLLYQIVDDDGFSSRRQPRGPTGDSGPHLTLSGVYDATRHVAALAPAFCQAAADFSPDALAQSVADAAAVVEPVLVCRQRDAAGGLLAETSVVLRHVNDSPETGPGSVIGQLVPAEDGVASLELVETATGTIVAGAAASAAAPTAAITATEIDAAAGRVRVSWTAADADGDPLVFTLLYRSTTALGEVVRTLRSDTRELSADIPLSALPAGTGNFRLLVTDGFRSVEVSGEEITIDEHAPELTISGLVAGQELDLWAAGSLGARLSATASDMDDGPGFSAAETAWDWTGPETGSAIGGGVTLGQLFPGDYSISATVTDGGGQTTTATLPFSVAVPAVPEAPSMALDGVRGGADYATAPTFAWPLTDGTSANASLAHRDGALFVVIEGLPLTENGSFAGLIIDSNNSRSVALEADDLAIEVTPTGAMAFWTGTTGTWTPADAPPALVEAITFQGETHWSVELRIPDAVIGGWGHLAGLRMYAGKPWPYDAFPATSDHYGPSTWFPVSFGPRPAPPAAAPTAHASGGGSFSPTVALEISLDGSQSTTSTGGTSGLTYAWTQTAGTPVVLTGTDQAVATFTLNPVAAPETLTFQLIVTAAGLDSPPEEITCYVYPAPEEIAWTGGVTNGAGVRLEILAGGNVGIHYDADYWFGQHGVLTPPGETPLPVAGAMFKIEFSADLEVWETLALVPADTAGQVEFVDDEPVSRRFYRMSRAGSAAP